MPIQQSDWDDELSILSAENVNFALETAGLGSRFAAVMIDLLLQGLAITLLLIAGSYFVIYFLPDVSTWSRWVLSVSIGVGLFVFFLLTYGYYFFFEWLWDGQTPGKRWLGLRALQTSGMPLTAWAAMTRNLFRIVDFLPIFYGIGGVVAWLNPHNRRIGDLIAGTVVTRERRAGKSAPILDIAAASAAVLASGSTPDAAVPESTAIAGTMPAPAAAAPVEPPDEAPPMDANVVALLARLNAQDYELIQEFLTRRDALAPIVRERLGQSLATRISTKLGEPMPDVVEPFLEAVDAALQRARQGN